MNWQCLPILRLQFPIIGDEILKRRRKEPLCWVAALVLSLSPT